MHWNRFAEKCECCFWPCTALHRGLTRILGLIFVYAIDDYAIRGYGQAINNRFRAVIYVLIHDIHQIRAVI